VYKRNLEGFCFADVVYFFRLWLNFVSAYILDSGDMAFEWLFLNKDSCFFGAKYYNVV
jgi:hypothetical protein